MTQAIPDLWPEIEQTRVVPPVAILREQAALLGKKTNHLLEGQVKSRIAFEGGFLHTFSIVAPALDGYEYKLFEVKHGPDQYPVEADAPESTGPLTASLVSLNSEQELLDYIRKILNSDKTKKILGSLLAQVKATA
jgi:hypothetical protein